MRLLPLIFILFLTACGAGDGTNNDRESSTAQSSNTGSSVITITGGAEGSQQTVIIADSADSQNNEAFASGNSQDPVNNELAGDAAKDPCAAGPSWKPVSESDGKLAVLSAIGDTAPWSSVAVFVAESGEVEFCEYFGLKNPEQDRQVWRCSLPGEFYTGDAEIEYAGQSCRFSVKDPAVREDLSVKE